MRDAATGSKRWELSNWDLRWKVTAVLAVPLAVAVGLGVSRISSEWSQANHLATASDHVGVIPTVTALSSAISTVAGSSVIAVAPNQSMVTDENLTALDQATGDAKKAVGQLDDVPEAQQALQQMIDQAGEVRGGGKNLSSRPSGEVATQIDSYRGESVRAVETILAQVSDPGLDKEKRRLVDSLNARVTMLGEVVGLSDILHDPAGGMQSYLVKVDTERALLNSLASRYASDDPDIAALRQGIDSRSRVLTGLPAKSGQLPLGELRQSILSSLDIYEKLVTESTGSIDQGVRGLADAALSEAIIYSIVVLVTILAALVLAVFVARSMITPLNRLRWAALQVAETDLPEEVAQLRTGASPEEVPLEPMPVDSEEEVGQLARAIDDIHGQALRLASDQAQMRSQVNDMFETLARRSKSLVDHQLSLIEAMEYDEKDPRLLENLFRLDHLAARMRRNGDNLLILAGTKQRRSKSAPVEIADVLRAAISEVEDYERVKLGATPRGALVEPAASDLAHLFAELLDNALRASPPESDVKFTFAQAHDKGLLIEVADRGIGIPPAELAEINRKLATAAEPSADTARHMGLFVVGRLAQRHGLSVRLRATFDTARDPGVTVAVHVPLSLIVAGQTQILPLASDSTQPAPAPAPAKPGGGGAFGGPVPGAPKPGGPQSGAPKPGGAAAAFGHRRRQLEATGSAVPQAPKSSPPPTPASPLAAKTTEPAPAPKPPAGGMQTRAIGRTANGNVVVTVDPGVSGQLPAVAGRGCGPANDPPRSTPGGLPQRRPGSAMAAGLTGEQEQSPTSLRSASAGAKPGSAPQRGRLAAASLPKRSSGGAAPGGGLLSGDSGLSSRRPGGPAGSQNTSGTVPRRDPAAAARGSGIGPQSEPSSSANAVGSQGATSSGPSGLGAGSVGTGGLPRRAPGAAGPGGSAANPLGANGPTKSPSEAAGLFPGTDSREPGGAKPVRPTGATGLPRRVPGTSDQPTPLTPGGNAQPGAAASGPSTPGGRPQSEAPAGGLPRRAPVAKTSDASEVSSRRDAPVGGLSRGVTPPGSGDRPESAAPAAGSSPRTPASDQPFGEALPARPNPATRPAAPDRKSGTVTGAGSSPHRGETSGGLPTKTSSGLPRREPGSAPGSKASLTSNSAPPAAPSDLPRRLRETNGTASGSLPANSAPAPSRLPAGGLPQRRPMSGQTATAPPRALGLSEQLTNDPGVSLPRRGPASPPATSAGSDAAQGTRANPTKTASFFQSRLQPAPENDSVMGGTPIFAEMMSAWLSDPNNDRSQMPASFESPGDEGWQAARRASQARPENTTAAGLPQRNPGGRLVPGGVTPAAGRRTSDDSVGRKGRRNPESIRSSLSRHQKGVRDGRALRAMNLTGDKGDR